VHIARPPMAILRNVPSVRQGASPGLTKWGGHQAEPLKAVWRRSLSGVQGPIFKPDRPPTPPPPPEKIAGSASIPETLSGKSVIDMSTSVNPVATPMRPHARPSVPFGPHFQQKSRRSRSHGTPNQRLITVTTDKKSAAKILRLSQTQRTAAFGKVSTSSRQTVSIVG